MSAKSKKAPLNRRRLGRHLRKLREQAGLTQEQVARKMRYSDSKISRFESGQLPDFHVMTAMLDLYGLTVDEWTPYTHEWDLASEPGWWAVYKLDDVGYVSMEHEAESVRSLEPAFVPGLLQTEAYTRAVFTRPGLHSKQWVDTQVAVRMRRKKRLTADLPLIYEAIIQEVALSRCDLEPALHRAQLHEIIDRAGLPNVTVRVIPEVVGTHEGLYGALTLLRFSDPEEDDVAYTEHALGSNHTDDEAQVNTARLRLDRIARLALDPAESIRLIERVADSL